MSLSELTARQLAEIDAICIEYERCFRRGIEKEIDPIVASASDVPAETLREELKAIRDELRQSQPRPLEPSAPVAAFGSNSSPTLDAARVEWPPSDAFTPSSSDEHTADTPVHATGEQTFPEKAEEIFHLGARLGPYRIESLIGQGGMGRVYRGRDERLERPVAIKVLADDWAQRPERVERFERESRAVAALRHPNIVSLYDVGTHAGRPYAVMELLDGETLRQRLDRGELTLEEIRQIGIQIASALAAAHDGGIVHRDLKPENLILLAESVQHSLAGSQEGVTLKLLDFGLSRAAEGELVGTGDQTATGVVMGTAGYMAPEQAQGLKATPAADIFSLGCVLHECFYGRKAFAGNTLAESLGAVLHKVPDIDPERAAEAPSLARLISVCLAKEVEQRPATASAVAAQLAEIDLNAVPPKRVPSWLTPSIAGAAVSASSYWRSRRTAEVIPAIDRRRWFELVGGAAAGIISVSSLPSWFKPIPQIDSIAVLPFYKLGGEQGQPLGGRELIEEERIAAMLVNELAKLPALKVRPFRPMTVADTRSFPSTEEFRVLAEELGVGGLVLVEVIGSGRKSEVNLQLVDAATGDVLWGNRFAYSGEPASLLERTDTASVLAEKIGQQVAALKATGQTKNEDAFFCLVRGKARFDPDSEEGMRSAIECFENAATLDDTFIDAHAGLALTAMALAARTQTEESQPLVNQAREAVTRAMATSAKELETSSAPLVNLAKAIVLWQADHRFVEAERFFVSALHGLPNYWQAHHEYALYQAAHGRPDAVELANRAVVLNPMALSLRLDEARLRWFQGDAERAQLQSASIRRQQPEHRHAKGLAIDVHEQNEEFEQAGRLLGFPDAGSLDRDRYFELRKASLAAVPYGPFGPTMNRAIWEARSNEMDEVRLQQIVDEQPPMLALLLAAHPALAEQRAWTPAKPLIPASAEATSGR